MHFSCFHKIQCLRVLLASLKQKIASFRFVESRSWVGSERVQIIRKKIGVIVGFLAKVMRLLKTLGLTSELANLLQALNQLEAIHLKITLCILDVFKVLTIFETIFQIWDCLQKVL